MYEANILLVDDETAILQLLTTILEKEGFSHITTATSAEMALSLTQQNDYDLIILDVMLPGQSGFDICPIIRKKTDCPIFFLTAKTSDLDKISGFSYGADDYITKPFHLDIVMAKVKSALRRGYGEYASAAESDCLGVNGLLLFPSQHVVEWQGQQTELTKNEFYLLECLMKQVNQYVTREELLEALWDEVAFVDDNTLTVNVKRVRKKLEELGIKNAIVTKRGYGYALLTEWGEGHEG